MKQIEICAVINKRFKKIEMLFSEVISRFEIESIHEFRTEIKKLRAFLRLLNVEVGDNSRFAISKKMKTFYSYAGTIRNLQLQLKNMDAYIGNSRYVVTETYVEYLKKMIEKWKNNAIEFMGSGSNFYEDEKKILKKIPGKLRKGSVKTFLQNKMNELEWLVKDLPDDDVLHSIRKIFKDILYTCKLIKQDSERLPAVFSEKTKPFIDLLGLFLDKGIGIILLETYCKDCEENGFFVEEEIKELKEIEVRWKKEKEDLSQIIYLKPGLLKLSAVS